MPSHIHRETIRINFHFISVNSNWLTEVRSMKSSVEGKVCNVSLLLYLLVLAILNKNEHSDYSSKEWLI